MYTKLLLLPILGNEVAIVPAAGGNILSGRLTVPAAHQICSVSWRVEYFYSQRLQVGNDVDNHVEMKMTFVRYSFKNTVVDILL